MLLMDMIGIRKKSFSGIRGKNLIEVSSKTSDNGKLKILCDEERRIGRQLETKFAFQFVLCGK